MMKKKQSVNLTLDLSKEADAYLKKHANVLATLPFEELSFVYNVLKGNNAYDEVSPDILGALSVKILHYLGYFEHNGTRALQVIKGGKGSTEEIIIPSFLSDLSIYTDIPETEIVFDFTDEQGKVHSYKVLCEFKLDFRKIVVAKNHKEGFISYFDLTFKEDERAVLTPITDERFEEIQNLWEVIRKEENIIV